MTPKQTPKQTLKRKPKQMCKRKPTQILNRMDVIRTSPDGMACRKRAVCFAASLNLQESDKHERHQPPQGPLRAHA